MNHQNETFPPSHFLEKRMTELSASELEEAILLPRRVDVAWTFDMSDKISCRKVDVRPEDVITQVLLGGRWASLARSFVTTLIQAQGYFPIAPLSAYLLSQRTARRGSPLTISL